jgi:hypothetical protein
MVAFDLKDALLTPEFLDSFMVQRRSQAMNNYGRAQSLVLWTQPVLGVVTAASPNQLARLPEEQHQAKTIEIRTTFAIQGPSEGVSPDIIVWNNDNYIVQILDDWSNYGTGFVHVVCTSMDSVDAPPVAPGVGQPQ